MSRWFTAAIAFLILFAASSSWAQGERTGKTKKGKAATTKNEQIGQQEDRQQQGQHEDDEKSGKATKAKGDSRKKADDNQQGENRDDGKKKPTKAKSAEGQTEQTGQHEGEDVKTKSKATKQTQTEARPKAGSNNAALEGRLDRLIQEIEAIRREIRKK